MSSELAIRVSRLSKRYVLGQHLGGQTDLRDAVGNFVSAPVRALRGRARREPRRTIWALKDVSVDVPKGEVLGIIGRNGAGKTTLLKILSRVTDPSAGEVKIWGRVGSLLEVGTGFHPDLTGRENVYLNGAILGMRRAEIARKFDEIVAFSEVERFIDTPVKRYSTGMQMRLAFSVAAHLEPEVLIVDEVLAVGDAAFQRKCMGKMSEVGSEGRTVLLVSHNMSAITSLASRCVWLENGVVREVGDAHTVVSDYLAETIVADQPGYADLSAQELRRGSWKGSGTELRFDSIRLIDGDGESTGVLVEDEPMRIVLGIRVLQPTAAAEILVKVRTIHGTLVCTLLSGVREVPLEAGDYETEVVVPRLPLRPGRYLLDLYMLTRLPQDLLQAPIGFEVAASRTPREDPRYVRDDLGVVAVDHDWTPLVERRSLHRQTA
jgi:lipopolysaccharide transport system ATP-binding protein